MSKYPLLLLCLLLLTRQLMAYPVRDTLMLNGTWQFDQTEKAFPPGRFTRTIPVPGFIHLAEPKIPDYDVFFRKPEGVAYSHDHNVEDQDYMLKYSWCRRTFTVPKQQERAQAVLTIRKSQCVTRLFINGMEVGSSMECFTPVEFPITKFMKAGQENEVLMQVGDRAWLPSLGLVAPIRKRFTTCLASGTMYLSHLPRNSASIGC